MEVRIKAVVIKSSDDILVLVFLNSFKNAYDSNGIHKRATICLFDHSMKDLVEAIFSHRMRATENSDAYYEENWQTAVKL